MRQALAALAACAPHVPAVVFNQADVAMHDLREALANPSALRHPDYTDVSLVYGADGAVRLTFNFLNREDTDAACNELSQIFMTEIKRS